MIIRFQPTIVCIVGPSGSGKTTLARFMEKAMNIPMLVSYTTRPKRDNEVDGIDHHFVTEDEMPSKDKMLAYTNFGGYHYWMPLSELEDVDVCTYVIDEKGMQMLQDKYGDEFIIIGVLVKRDKQQLIRQVGEERVKRDLGRIAIPEENYSMVIENNGRIEDFLAESFKIFNEIFG